jgi:hypothetical protein
MSTYSYTVWSLDVWGNDDDGYEVNDRCKVGTIDLDATTVIDSDQGLMEALIEAGYLKPGSDSVGEVEGESDYTLFIGDGDTGCPWLQLERIKEETNEAGKGSK